MPIMRSETTQRSLPLRRPRIARLLFGTLVPLLGAGSAALGDAAIERHEELFTERDSYLETPQRQQQQYNRQLIIVDGFVDTDQCWTLLDESDVDDDGRVDADEYVEFARNAVPNVLPDSPDLTYDDLPEAYMAAFEATACLCRNPLAGGNPDDTDCCVGENAHIRIPVAPSQSPNSTEVNYLYTACSLTTGAAEIVANSEAPAATEAPVAGTSNSGTDFGTHRSTDFGTDDSTERRAHRLAHGRTHRCTHADPHAHHGNGLSHFSTPHHRPSSASACLP